MNERILLETQLPAFFGVIAGFASWHVICSLSFWEDGLLLSVDRKTLMKSGRIVHFSFFVAALHILVLSPPLFAGQNIERKGHIRGTVGYSKVYLDEPGDVMVAGSVLFALTSNWGFEPEVLWISGDRFEEKGFAINCVYDFRKQDQRVRPYVILGLGYVHELDKAIDYRRGKMTWNGGVGVRGHLTRRLFVSPEARFGFQAVPRLTVGFGYEF